jgi:hypothetical protein
MTSKRHAKPTALQLAERTYRKVIEFKRIILNQMAIIRLDIMEARIQDRTHMRTLTDHCARLLREKETLQKRLAMYDPPHIGSHPGYLYCINRISKGEKCGADRAPITDRLTLVDLNNKEQSKERKEALEKRAADILNAAFDTANGGRAEHE